MLNQVLDALLDHVRLSLKGGNGIHNLLHEVLVHHGLVGLHLLDSVGVYDLTTLTDNTLHSGFVIVFTLYLLFFLRGGRHYVNSEVFNLASKLEVDAQLLSVRLELRLFDFLVNNSELRVTELEETTIELLLRNVGVVLEIFISPGVLSVESKADSSLEDVHDNLERFISEGCGYFSLAVMVKPIELPVVMLILVESSISSLALLHGSRDRCGRRSICGPGSVG